MPSRDITNRSARFRRMVCGGLLPALILLSWFGGMWAGHALAAVRDDFESGQVTWRAGDADAQYRLESQQRITADPHSGQASELIQISAGVEPLFYFTHDVGSARIVAELSPSVWIKANRPGIQLLARVILPHTPDPRTGQPTATLDCRQQLREPGHLATIADFRHASIIKSTNSRLACANGSAS